MLINAEKCTGCGVCLPYCQAGAISLVDGKAVIDQELCLECGTCGRTYVVKCPKKAIYENPNLFDDELRSIRKYFSDPMTHHKITKVPGRGTEEVKTNDVTGRVPRGRIGVAVEMGRPVLGTSIAQIQEVTKTLASMGIAFERDNPLTHLMEDSSRGIFPEYMLEERIVSAIIEFSISEEKLPDLISVLRDVAGRLETVFTLDMITRFDDDGGIPLLEKLKEMQLEFRPNAKINLGLGRPLREV